MPKRIDRTPNGLVDGLIKGVMKRLAETTDTERLASEVVEELSNFTSLRGLGISRFKDGIFRSEDINQKFETLYLYLSALYKGLIVNEEWQRRQSSAVLSEAVTARRGILKNLQDLRLYKFVKRQTQFNDAKVIDFTSVVNRDVAGSGAKVDDRSKKLQLAEFSRTRINERKLDVEPEISVTYLTNAVTGFSSQAYKKENAIDADPESFWSESAFSDSPVISTYLSTNYYGFGVSAVLDLRQCERINRIDLRPFGQLPCRLISLETSQDGLTFTQLPSFVEPSVTDDWWVFYFSPLSVRYIKVVLLQENYYEQHFSLPKRVLENQVYFDHLLKDDLRLVNDSRNDSLVETRRFLSEDGFGLVLDTLSRLEEKFSDTVLSGDSGAEKTDLETILKPIMEVMGTDDLSLIQSATEPKDETVVVKKFVYNLGLYHIEAIRAEYVPYSEFSSSKIKVEGSLEEIAVKVSDSSVNLTDASGTSFPGGTVEYSVELSPTRTIPVLPKDAASAYEVVSISNRNRKGVVRFTTSDSSPLVWKNGVPLVRGSDFSFSSSTKVLSIEPVAYSPSSVYLIKYTPTSGQDIVDITNLYSSYKISPPEKFSGTDRNGLLKLTYTPFVDFSKINNTDLFFKDSTESKFIYRSDVSQSTIDGEVWGIVSSTVSGSVSASTTTISVASTSGFSSSGVLSIDSEQVKYTSLDSGTFYGCVRGYNGTTATTHGDGASVHSVANSVYEPLKIYIDGIKARNKTDYLRGEHPTLDPLPETSLEYNFIQIGNRIYFGSPINETKTIEVQYRVLSEYVSLRAVLKRSVAGNRLTTPTITDAILLLNRGEL